MWSIDIKIKSVLNYINISKSFRITSYNFGIPISTIYRWYKVYIKYGIEELKKVKINNNRIRIITSNIKENIKNIISDDPFINIKDIIHKLGIKVSINTISRTLKNMKITIKNAINRLEYKNKDLSKEREEFITKIRNKKDIICLDETGIQYEMRKTRGRSYRGTKIYIKRKAIYYRRQYSCLMIISKTDGIKYKLYSDSVNRNKLLDFINKHETYFKNKTLVLDNVSFHKSKEIIETLTKLNCEILYTPPYSPFLNPIEEVFAQLKHYIKESYKENIEYKIRIKNAVNKITNIHINNYYKHAFY